MGSTMVLERLVVDEPGVFPKSFDSVCWLGMSFAYRAGGLNLVNDLTGDWSGMS